MNNLVRMLHVRPLGRFLGVYRFSPHPIFKVPIRIILRKSDLYQMNVLGKIIHELVLDLSSDKSSPFLTLSIFSQT